MRPVHLLLVFVLLLAGGLFWILAGTETPSAEGVEIPAAAVAPAPPAAPDAAPDLAALEGIQPGDSRVVSAAPPVAARSPSPAPVNAAANEGPAIHGQVLDASGRPVEGAAVYASHDQGFGGPPLDARLFESSRWTKRYTATTGADGEFALRGPRPGKLRVAVRCSGFAPYDAQGIALPAGDEHRLEPIVLATGVVLAGRVVDPSGRGVAGAEILRLQESQGGLFFALPGSSSSSSLAAVTTADGSFRIDQLAAGPWRLRVVTESFPDRVESGSTERPGQRVEGLVIALEPGLAIEGRIVGATPDQLAGVQVRAAPLRAGDDDALDEAFASPELGEARRAPSAADGGFLVQGLRAGRKYRLSARRARAGSFADEDFGTALSSSVVAAAGERGVQLPWQPEAALVFQVLDGRTGQPLEAFEVYAGIDWRMPLMDPQARGVKKQHPLGRVRFGNLRPRTGSERASLEIRAVGYRELERKDLALSPGEDTDLGPIALEPMPVVRVTVLDDRSGAPVAEARVVLREPVAPPLRAGRGERRFAVRAAAAFGDDLVSPFAQERRGRTDAEGVAILSSLEGQAGELEVVHPSFAAQKLSVPASIDTVQEVSVRLKQGGSALVRVRRADGTPAAGVRVEHVAGEDEGASFPWVTESGPRAGREVTDTRGEVLCEHLAEGTHRFRVQASDGPAAFTADDGEGGVHIALAGFAQEERGNPWVEVQVVEGERSEVALVAPSEVAVFGRVREGGEALAGATVRLSPARGEDEPPLPMLGGRALAKTDGDGRYRIEGVRSGEYVVSIDHPRRAMPAELDLRVEASDLRFDAELHVCIVEGRITDERGEPLKGVRVWPEKVARGGAPRRQMLRIAMFADDDGEGEIVSSEGPMGMTQARTDADGRYELRGLLSGVDLVVRAEAKELQPGKSPAFELSPDQVKRGVDLRLEAAGRIEVVATRADGSPGRHLLAIARYAEDAKDGESAVEPKSGFIAEKGRTTLDGLKPGRWTVELRPMGPEAESI